MPVVVAGLFRYPVKGLAGIAVDRAPLAATGLAGDRSWLVVRGDGRFLTQRQEPRLALLRATPTADGLVLDAGPVAPERSPLPVPEPGTGSAVRRVRIWRDEVPARDAGDGAAAWLSAVLGTPDLRLVRAVDEGLRRDPDRFGASASVRFADAAPLLVTTTASLRALNDALRARGREPVPMDRFRPNVVLDGLEPFAEHAPLRLVGPRWTLRLVDPCERCVVPTIDQGTGRKDPQHEPYRTLVAVDPVPGAPDRPAFGQNAVVEAGAGEVRVGDRIEVTA